MPNTGTPAVEQRRVGGRRARLVHRGRAAGQDDRLRLAWPAARPPASRTARSRSRRSPREPGGRSAARTAPRSRRRGRCRSAPAHSRRAGRAPRRAGRGSRVRPVEADPGQLLAEVPQLRGQCRVLPGAADPRPDRADRGTPPATAARCRNRARPRSRRTGSAARRPRRTGTAPCRPPGPDPEHRVGAQPVRSSGQVGRRHARDGPPSRSARAVRGRPPLQLLAEQQVGQLGVGVGGLRAGSPAAGLPSSTAAVPPRCASEDTVTTRAPGAASSAGSSRPVSAKWPRWLVPNCSSKPSSVGLPGAAAPSRRRC